MKITGIITEYNPFHNGHKYQITEAKKSCDAVVCVMSGSFVQRGDIAVFDKWTRAEIAVKNGVDLVLELPVCYVLASAEKFAYGSAATLNALGIVDTLCFGSECGDIEKLKSAAHLIMNEPPEVSEKIKLLMDSGLSYPSAREKAYGGYIDADILKEPNNILALEYIKALETLKSSIEPMTIKRHMTGHHQTTAVGKFASASEIRRRIAKNEPISELVPFSEIYPTYDISRLDTALTAILRSITPEKIKKLPDVGEGIENRIKSAADKFSTVAEIAESVKTKRYTMTRINRILMSALLGLDAKTAVLPPQYIRVLAMTAKGREILSLAKKTSSLPIITKTANFDKNNELLKKDILATDISALCCTDKSQRISGRDFLKSPIIIL